MQDYKQRIQTVLDYIDQHLEEELTSEALAHMALFSKSHFHKVFEVYTGHTLMAYIRGLRVRKAAKEIRCTRRRIADIAYEFGFESHDVFGRAFKRIYGITPERFRTSNDVVHAFGGIKLSNKEVDYCMVKSKIVTKPEMKLIGIERRIQEGDWGLFIADTWKHYFENWNALFGNVNNRISPELQIDYALANDREEEGVLTYFIGIEVSNLNDIPQGTVGRIVPRTKYAKFTAVGRLPDSMGSTFNYIFKEWFPASPFQITAGPILEHYDVRCSSNNGVPPEQHEMDVYIPIEPALFQTREIVDIQSFRIACYRATGEPGKPWKKVKQEAFDVMIRWAKENGLLSNITAFGANNNGGVPDNDFFYEVFLKIDGVDLEPQPQYPITIRTYDGGLHVVSQAIHRYLEPSGRSVSEWIKNSDYRAKELGYEEFYIVNGKVELDTMIKIHIRVEKK